ncbi:MULTISPECIES: MetQ/NlpA family ABC transporter substrate-binding protein [Aerococcus]|uniref:Lipoprotein n=4 Tax=Lactobacillales TaxID=186826 RepID=A0A1E9P9D9_9LACT|nr:MULTISPECIES: MetQ/NlpA family ABC transporter substrate-binding protein [Aerococcus]KAA9234422.1 MetQ/NlpA family ABC transporter substrate-binding protein [Aerococcus mictus]KAA9242223.1 MetQ/NlpA family ABC transporter substrate-binding protein [Aerococcus urinae]KAA9291549.1 MetQ/NlpA family ABC transporter substrate-binding protein [Aerococcus mictus]MBU5610240.1 MetQ/NlpA family ABC transporter substrate-binding protein [Aerococcus urinae]MCY3034851.1 MetQ/NlpA family ABC transporter 
MKKWQKVLVTSALSILALAGCGSNSGSGSEGKQETTVKLGVVGDDTRDWDTVQERLKAEGINLEYVKFSDYNQPNKALEEGEVDLNAFQHQVFLDKFNEQFGTDLVSIGNTVVAPLGIYSHKIKNLSELQDGATVSIPNDVTNGGRAIILLESAGLIEVDDAAGITPTVDDITSNPKKLKIEEMDAAQTPRTLNDVDIALINSGYAVDAGLAPQDAIFKEPVDERSKPYVNIVVARQEDKDNPTYKKIVDTYQTDETEQVIKDKSNGANVAAWKLFGRN